jgi:type IV pilus assembly protein PilO
MKLRTKEIIIFISLFLLISVGFTSLYLYLILPTQREFTNVKIELKSELIKLGQLANTADQNLGVDIDTVRLQEQTPVSPLIDNMLLDIKYAEGISNSKVRSISISEGDAAALWPQEQPAQTQQQGETAPSTDQENARAPATQAVPPVVGSLKRIVLNTTVSSPNYESLQKFIQGLENLRRIINVDSITFDSGGEGKMEYSVSFSAFYAPEYKGLLEDFPERKFIPASKKKNPLPAVQ